MIHTDIYLELIDSTNGITELVPAANIDIEKAKGNPRLEIYQAGIIEEETTMDGRLSHWNPVMRFAAKATDFAVAYAITQAVKTLFNGQTNVTVGTSTVSHIKLKGEADLASEPPEDDGEKWLMGRYVDLLFEIVE